MDLRPVKSHPTLGVKSWVSELNRQGSRQIRWLGRFFSFGATKMGEFQKKTGKDGSYKNREWGGDVGCEMFLEDLTLGCTSWVGEGVEISLKDCF